MIAVRAWGLQNMSPCVLNVTRMPTHTDFSRKFRGTAQSHTKHDRRSAGMGPPEHESLRFERHPHAHTRTFRENSVGLPKDVPNMIVSPCVPKPWRTRRRGAAALPIFWQMPSAEVSLRCGRGCGRDTGRCSEKPMSWCQMPIQL